MELKKLAIALLALYIVYCFMSKEKYAFNEPGLQFPEGAGYIDIYHKADAKGQINNVTYSANIAPEKNGNTTADGNVATITNFTSKVPKSIVLYGVNYGSDKNIAYYRPMDTKNATAVQVEMQPGKEIIFRNLNAGNIGTSFPKEVKDAKGKVIKQGFKDGDIIHTGRFVFTF